MPPEKKSRHLNLKEKQRILASITSKTDLNWIMIKEGISKSSLYRLIKEGAKPRPIQVKYFEVEDIVLAEVEANPKMKGPEIQLLARNHRDMLLQSDGLSEERKAIYREAKFAQSWIDSFRKRMKKRDVNGKEAATTALVQQARKSSRSAKDSRSIPSIQEATSSSLRANSSQDASISKAIHAQAEFLIQNADDNDPIPDPKDVKDGLLLAKRYFTATNKPAMLRLVISLLKDIENDLNFSNYNQ